MSTDVASQSETTSSDDAELDSTESTRPDEGSLLELVDETPTSERAGANAEEGGDDLFTPADDGEVAAPERPAWLPEGAKFWDDKEGLQGEQLFKSYTSLRQRLSGGEAKIPEAPDGYEFKGPDGTPADPADKANAWFKSFAHELGAPKGLAERMYTGFIKWAQENAAPPPPSRDDELEALGPQGKDLLRGVNVFFEGLRANGTYNDMDLARARGWLKTAGDVAAMQKIMQSYGEKPIPMPSTAGAGRPTEREAYAAMGERIETGTFAGELRYDHDAAYRAKVDKMFLDAVGDAPAGASSNFNPAA